jgi:chaperonin GroES
MASVRPLDDRIVVKPLEAEEKTRGGIVLPDTAKEKPARGKVVAVGPGKLLPSGDRVKPAIKQGELVLYGKYSGTDIKIAGEEVKIVRESDVLGKFE